MRTTEIIIEEIKELIVSKGYIYALCMIIFDDFHVNPEKMQDINYRERLSNKEASLLLGFLIQNLIDFNVPESPQDLIQMKQRTYELLEELHESISAPFFAKLKNNIEAEHRGENSRADQKEFFGKRDMLVESIFYSGAGVYDFQYLDFLEKKYKYDIKWLTEERELNITDSKNIVLRIKDIFQEKSKKVHWYDLKQRLPIFIERMKKKNANEDWDKHAKDSLPMLEFHQYKELFFDCVKDEEKLSIDEIRDKHWKSFYKNLIDLFVIEKSNFSNEVNIEAFLNNFSVKPHKGLNSHFKTIGHYNIINSHPIIRLDHERYFVPMVFLLFESLYESPFYWMVNDKAYIDKAGKNRGKTGEEITYDFLLKVFGINRTFKSVKIISQKGSVDTDIDVLCILGSKALCVQVKSKKLTELSRKGDDESLKNDFQKAVQDTYEQGLICRQRILEKGSTFIDEDGHDIKLSEEIDEVYIMGITTENYPSLTHQCHVMLDKKDNDPFPIILTIFDLEIIIHYLQDPYDFLYYIRQRTVLMDYFIAEEEIVFLGYHLNHKLWKAPNRDLVLIDQSIGQLIDRNYYPLKLGLEISDEGDKIKNRWINEDFDNLCKEIKTLKDAKITDIIFHLLDWSGEARKNLVSYIKITKLKTLKDEKFHNFSMPPNDSDSLRVGVTYISLNTNDRYELKNMLLSFCRRRKYISKADAWIGFGSVKNGVNMIDAIAFNNQKWVYNEELEKVSKDFFEAGNQGKFIRLGQKIGRNDKCHCGSGLKYKKCCGKER